MIYKFVGCLLAIVSVVIAVPSSAQAENTFENKLQEADLVFEGVVESVTYRAMELSNGESLPYTFVTYSVNDVLKGDPDQQEVTLRFLGGLAEGGGYLEPEGTPFFDKGDHDLLLVVGNNTEDCPLVGCAAGRFRFIGGLMVDDHGYHVQITKAGKLISGKRLDLDDINNHEVGGLIDHSRNSDKPKNLTEAELDELRNSKNTVTPADFTERMRQEIKTTHTPDELQSAPALFESSDPHQPIVDARTDKLMTQQRQPEASDFQPAPKRLTPAEVERLDRIDAKHEAVQEHRRADLVTVPTTETKVVARHVFQNEAEEEAAPFLALTESPSVRKGWPSLFLYMMLTGAAAVVGAGVVFIRSGKRGARG
jgi:hypothetical protein